MKKIKFLFVILMPLLLVGCNRKNQEVLNVLNWSSYIPDSVIHDFEREYNIKVNYGTYSSNEELLAKISNSKSGTYDVIFPSDYMVSLMIEKDLIEELDKTKLTNINNINTVFLNQEYDKNNKYSIPFLSTIVVIVVNKDKIKDNITSYNDLLNPKYENNIVILDDQRITIGMALLALNYNMNEVDDYKLNQAKEWLLSLKNNIKAYDSDSPKTFFLTEEADIGVMWNAEAELAKVDGNNIDIIYPKEGHAISTDNYCIVKGAKNKKNAYLFINYLLRNNISSTIVNEYPYISPNKIVQFSSIKTYDIFNNGHYVKNIGENISKYDKIWADIK